MAWRVVMPSFGMYTADGTLVSWRKPHGAAVEAGETLLEIETDKAVEEVNAPARGIVHHVLDPGARLQVESLIGYILAPGEAPPLDAQLNATVARGETSAPQAPRVAARADLRASPIARRLAREHQIDLGSITGTGPDGRIVEADVRAAIERRTSGEEETGL